jgi:hypothetical protein
MHRRLPSTGSYCAGPLVFSDGERAWPSLQPVFLAPLPDPTGAGQEDDASLILRQRERKLVLLFWQLFFCRLFNESAYRHLGLQFFNQPTCRNPTSPGKTSNASGTGDLMYQYCTISLDRSQEAIDKTRKSSVCQCVS